MLIDTETAVTSSKASDMTYQYHEAEDIHEIHLNHANQQTMTDFFQVISQHYYARPISGTTRVLIRQTGPALPLNHFMNEMRAFISQHRKRPQSAPARFAIVLELTPFLQLIKQLLRLMRHQDAVTFFDQNDEAKAREWLQKS
jgi:hypothetical protein